MDTLRINVKGGPGGMGLPKFGGIGGNGGEVIFEAKEGINWKHYKSPLVSLSNTYFQWHHNLLRFPLITTESEFSISISEKHYFRENVQNYKTWPFKSNPKPQE